MSSPVGHFLAGGAFSAAAQRVSRSRRMGEIFLVFLFANLPDIDYLFGLTAGRPNKYHHQWTHSLFFAVLTGILVVLFLRISRRRWDLKPGFIYGGVTLTHVLVDMVSADSSVPYGVQLLWPFSSEYYISPLTVLADLHKGMNNDGFIQSLICEHNLYTVLRELVILLPLFAAAVFLRYGRHHGKQTLKRRRGDA